MNATDFYPSKTSHRAMAAGVLKQAKTDLRRFHGATSTVERELYLDVYGWLTVDECSWPFSFVNVCDLMGVTPAQLRQELIGDHALGIFRYRMRRCGRISRLQTSLIQLFANERNAACEGMPIDARIPDLSRLVQIYEPGATP